MIRYSMAKSFEAFWEAHVTAVEPAEQGRQADRAAQPV